MLIPPSAPPAITKPRPSTTAVASAVTDWKRVVSSSTTWSVAVRAPVLSTRNTDSEDEVAPATTTKLRPPT